MDLTEIMRAGGVTRWHQNPDMPRGCESLAEHQWRVTMIALWIDPDISRDEIVEALSHDVAELYVGDISSPTRADGGEWASLHTAAEGALREQMGFPSTKSPVLELADKIAAWETMLRFRPGLRHLEDWQRMEMRIYARARTMSVQTESRVRQLISQWHARLEVMGE